AACRKAARRISSATAPWRPSRSRRGSRDIMRSTRWGCCAWLTESDDDGKADTRGPVQPGGVRPHAGRVPRQGDGAQAEPAAAAGTERDALLRGPADHAVPGPGDAAGGADLRARGHR